MSTGMQFTVKGSKFTLGERISGPPSKMFPLIRDLATRDKFVIGVAMEVDLHNKRMILIPQSIATGGTATGGLVYKGKKIGAHQPVSRGTIPLEDILAFRVVRVVTKKDDQEFKWNTPDYPFPSKTDEV